MESELRNLVVLTWRILTIPNVESLDVSNVMAILMLYSTASRRKEYSKDWQNLAISDELRARIELSRVILISAIVIHHVRIPSDLVLFSWDNIGYIRGYIQIGLLKTAASTLTVISGYLCFAHRFEQNPVRFLSKKFTTLFIPMLLWNVPMAVLIFTFQSRGIYLEKYDNLTNGDIFNWVNALLGLTHEPANAPLHFIRNLIACNIIAVCIAVPFRRYPAIIFGLIVVVGLFDLDGFISTRNDILIGFFLGALVAATSIEVCVIDFLLFPSAALYLVSAFFIFYLQVDYDSFWWLAHRFLGFLAAWPLIGYLSRTNLGHKMSKYSNYMFFVFLSHYYVLIGLFHVFMTLSRMNTFYIYFIIAGPLTIIVCIVVQVFAKRVVPTLLSASTGGRSQP